MAVARVGVSSCPRKLGRYRRLPPPWKVLPLDGSIHLPERRFRKTRQSLIKASLRLSNEAALFG